jgi:hypothetical protein
MRSSSQPTVDAAELLADDLHLLRMFCQIADYEVAGAVAPDSVAEAPPCTSSQQSPSPERTTPQQPTDVTHK